ncbi:MAG: pseudouridine synthase, partial [Holophagales bacterium]|nr:pseudouridine synthase [Holophagales bacterium]
EDRWRRRFEQGLVLGPAGPLPLDAPYAPHLEVGYFRELDHEAEIPFEERIVFRDAHLLAVDKPPFLPVVPGGRFVRECLLYRLEARLGDRTLAPVHRLDRLTAGLVLFARRPEERAAYGRVFAHRSVEKTYEAWAHLPPIARSRPGRAWTVEQRIVPGEPFFRMGTEPVVSGAPANARTRVELLEIRDGLGRFRLHPETGKKHQLRLAMAELGFPIVGDPFYPELLPETADDFSNPLRLLARELRFQDPITGRPRAFRSSFPLPGKKGIRLGPPAG